MKKVKITPAQLRCLRWVAEHWPCRRPEIWPHLVREDVWYRVVSAGWIELDHFGLARPTDAGWWALREVGDEHP